MSEHNCLPTIHTYPEGTNVTLEANGTTTCFSCGFTWIRHQQFTAVLGEHMDNPSGRVRLIRFENLVPCPSCGAEISAFELPCGADNLSGVFSPEMEFANPSYGE